MMKKDFKSKPTGEKRPRNTSGFNPNKSAKSPKEGEKPYNFRDNPKTYSRPTDGKKEFGFAKPSSKPHISKFDPNDRYGKKTFDNKPKDDFDQEKPRFERSENTNYGDRPKRNFDNNRPRFEGKEAGFDKKPFSDRPTFSDRPKRNFENDRPKFGNSDRSFGDKPRRSFDGDRPERKEFDKPLKRYQTEKPKFEEPAERPAGKFDNDKSRFANTPGRAPRSFGEAPRTPRGPKRFEGPYQKNLNTDTGGTSRSDRRDKYRSDGAHFDYENRLKETIEEKNGTIRLNRFIANSGICSRRDADELIEAGQITVNGEVITEMGHQVKPTDAIKYGAKLLTREKMVYLLLNKPKDYITTTEDPQERKTVMNLISGACKERIYPVGRLDRNTTGLLFFTNDGELASKLTHPSNNVEKMYQVELDKPITEEDYQKILKGITLEDGEIKADSFGIVTPDAMVVGIQIHSGRNHIVRRIFAHLGYEVMKLDRTVFAGLNKKDLPRGNYRMLTEKEVIKLKYLS